MVNAGKLHHRVQIQQPIRAADAQGGSAVTWTTLNTGQVWADIAPTTGSKRYEAMGVFHNASHTITIRYFDGLKSDYRVLYGSKVYRIKGIVNEGYNNTKHVLFVEEATA
jgi:SPP1 family predicted phage head-tail adaptor